MAGPSGAVFLSYASQDAEAAQRICDALRTVGIEVWFDQSELRGGDAWDRQIRKQIHDCALFIPIISAHSQLRLEGYFRREWKLAADRTHDMAEEKAFLVPVTIDDTSELHASVPDKFREVQWTRLPAGATPGGFIERVAKLLSPDELAGATPTHAPAAPGAVPRQPAAGDNSHRKFPAVALLIALVVAMLAVGYLALDKFLLSKRAAVPDTTFARGSLPAQIALPEKSIAVLPFVDMSEKKDQEYFADGMAAEVLDLLAKIPGLKVIGRTSSFQFKARADDLRAIGVKLGATYLVEGSVRKMGDHVRVTAQLIEARDGAQRWSSTYDRKSSDALEVQDAIAVNLARALQLTVSSDFGSRSAAKSDAAYDLYLRGLHAFDQSSQEDMEQAAANFQQALDLDPTFAPAALGLAKVYQFRGEEAWDPPSIDFARARQAADLAIRLDPTLGAAHAVRAEILMIHDWDWVGADREVQQALNLGSGVEATEAAGRMAAVRGDWGQATQLLEKALAVDPLNPELQLSLAWHVDLRTGRFAQAESLMRRALETSPNLGTGRWFLGLSLLFQNRLDEALAVFKEEKPEDGQYEGSAAVYHAMGKEAESDAMLKLAIGHNTEFWPSATARAYAFRGERDQAMKWLERAYSVRDVDLYAIKHDPLMKNLEADPRYQALLRKMNWPE